MPRHKSLAPLLILTALCAASRPSAADTPVLSPLQIESALTDLKGADWILSAQAMSALGRAQVRQAVVPIKVIYASTNVPWVKGRALIALSQLCPGDMLPEAQKSLKSPDAPLRAAAAEALGQIGEKQAAAEVLAAVKDPDSHVQFEALVAYARLLGQGAWETVGPAAASTDPSIARAAARGLQYVPSKAARDKLLELLEHTDGGVRLEAAASFSRAQYAPAIPALLRHYASDPGELVRGECRRALRSFEPAALVEPLLAVFKADDAALYEPVLWTLEFCHSQKAYDEVARIIRSPEARYAKCRPLALDVLGAADAERYRDLFTQYVRDSDAATRAQAVRNLARCKEVNHFEVFRPFLVDSDPGVAAAAFGALSRAPKADPPGGILAYLAEPLKSASEPVNHAALGLLAERLKPEEMSKAIPVLERFLNGSDDELRNLAAKAFANAADDDIKTNIARLQGYVVDWSVAGPFPNDIKNSGMALVYPPENEVDLEKTYGVGDVAATQPEAAQGFLATVKELKAAWSSFHVKQATGRFSFNEVPYPGGKKITYFYATFEAAADKPIILHVPAAASEAAADKTMLWLNGARVELPRPQPREPSERNDKKDKKAPPAVVDLAVPAALTKGTNRLLLKVAVDTPEVWNWLWFVRMVDEAGKPVEALKFRPVN